MHDNELSPPLLLCSDREQYPVIKAQTAADDKKLFYCLAW